MRELVHKCEVSWRFGVDIEQIAGRLHGRCRIYSCARTVETQGNINKLEMWKWS
jgi:hypothetical protein